MTSKTTPTAPAYRHQTIESKWQKQWEKRQLNRPDLDKASRPFYNLMMYPYPSAEGLHVGNVYAFTGADIFGRFQRMQGFDVFEPIGFDSGGIHSENFAIQMGVHPRQMTTQNIAHFTQQLKSIGAMYDWKHTVDAMDPAYYKWTQWIFIQLFKAGLAYKKEAPVIWCPSCKTTLSDEQTEKKNNVAVCERCKTPVEHRQMNQWFFRITKYADRLLKNTYQLNWSKKVLVTQRNWIGKNEGINIEYEIAGRKGKRIICFTTRPDTNFGATFIVLAPEHPIINQITTKDNKTSVSQYIKQALAKKEIERITEGRKKTGVFTGAYAVNRLNGEKIPIWISDFVLGHVGTGAVVGVPGHDKRDFEFAQTFKLPIVRVVVGSDGDKSPITRPDQVQEEEGIMVNSEFLNDLDIHQATTKMMDYLENKGWGKRTTAYKLRDWCISRQRYWGPPIPMIKCSKCGWQPVPEKDLPVLLPDIDDYLPDGSGKAPLARHSEFYQTKCPKCGGKAHRETDVSDTFLDSSWYFLAYPNRGTSEFEKIGSTTKTTPFNPHRTRKWLPVNQYTGGAEHSVLHLMYSRFITMALHDLGYLGFEEPFPKFFAHGLIIKDGAKMSKSRGNVVNPDEYIAKYGTDALRLYLMFIGPFDSGGDFRDTGMEGMVRFVKRLYHLLITPSFVSTKNQKLLKTKLHQTIKAVTEDIEQFSYNTAIAKIMELVNLMYDVKTTKVGDSQAWNEARRTLTLLLAPFAPHLAEEIWAEHLHQSTSVHTAPWPTWDKTAVKEANTTLAIQVNGKLRSQITVPTAKAKNQKFVVKQAQANPKIKIHLAGKTVKQTIFVPSRLVNFVVV